MLINISMIREIVRLLPGGFLLAVIDGIYLRANPTDVSVHDHRKDWL